MLLLIREGGSLEESALERSFLKLQFGSRCLVHWCFAPPAPKLLIRLTQTGLDWRWAETGGAKVTQTPPACSFFFLSHLLVVLLHGQTTLCH